MLSATTTDARPKHGGRPPAGRVGLLAVVALLAAALSVVAGPAPAQAAQAAGDDVPAWSPGWSWTYQTTFRYVAPEADVTLNESVTYTVAGIETFRGQSAYRLGITGTITGGSGTANVEGIGRANLSNFAGTVSGTKLVRRSDLALLQESQQQRLTARASLSILSTNISAGIDLQMTPQEGWRAIAFPVDAGQGWRNDVDVDYTGGFTFDAGSFGSGGSDFDGTFSFDSPATVTDATISVPAGSVATSRVHSQAADGQTVNTHWWSPGHRNDAQEHLRLPLDDGSLTLDRRLSSASLPAPATTLTQTVTPSLSCAGGEVTVTGRLSTGAAGVPVTVALDRSPVAPGQTATTNTTTTSGGSYSATVTAPAVADGLEKNGVRGSWGVLVSALGAANVATLVVTPQSCSVLAYTGPTSAPQGNTASVSATLTDRTGGSAAGRTVRFALSGGASVDAVTDADGVARAELPVAGPPRDATLTALFAGGGGLEPASTSTPFTVGTVPTSTAVVATPAVVTVGDPVRFTATVTPAHGDAPAQGTVQFRVDGADFGSAVTLTGGTATSPALSTLGLGDHTVTAVYAGSTDHGGSTAPAFTFRVRQPLLPTTTTATVAPASAVHGQPVTLSARVTAGTGTPTGAVTFTAGGTTLGTAGLDAAGETTLTTTEVPVGSHQVVASYSGDDTYDAGSSSPRVLTVDRAEVGVELTASDTTTVAGEAVSYTASVTVVAPGGGTPDGTAQLVVDGTHVGAPVALAGGSAAFPPVTSLGAGTHTVSVEYSGSDRYAGGTDSLQQVVEQADTSTTVVATPSPSVEEQNVELTAVVAAVAPGSGAPSGTVTFLADGEPVGSAPLQAAEAGATAVLDVADLAPGTHQVVARFAGDADYRASESEAVTHTVVEGAAIVATTTSLTSSRNPSTHGELITFRADVDAADDSAPSGAVQFSVDGTDVGGPVPVGADGVAESATLASPDPGDHTVIATFVPDTGYAGSGELLTQTVESAGVEVVLTSSAADAGFGEEIRFTATVSSLVEGTGTPTGYVQFAVDGHPIGSAVEVEDGSARSRAVADLPPGRHLVTAVYSGDVRFAPRLTELEQSVARIGTTTELDVSATSATFGDPVELTATVSPGSDALGVPTGTVRFLAGDRSLAAVPVAPGADGDTAVATLAVADLGAGTHDLRAVYTGSTTFAPSTSEPAPLEVARAGTALRADAAVVSLQPLGLPFGQLRATLTAGPRPLPGAAVDFTVGSRTVCRSTTDARGVATCDAAAQVLQIVLGGGYTASYAGDADHLPSSGRGLLLK